MGLIVVAGAAHPPTIHILNLQLSNDPGSQSVSPLAAGALIFSSNRIPYLRLIGHLMAYMTAVVMDPYGVPASQSTARSFF